MNRTHFIIFTAPIILCLFFIGHAAPSPQGESAPTNLVLEITYHKGRPPAYQPVRGAASRPGGGWYALFRRLSSWQPPAGSLPVRAVNILSRVEGDSVRVVVSVFLGVQFHDQEKAVATYTVREDEKITVSGLARFGVEPFEIKVARVNSILSDLPQIVNETDSIAVTNLEANNSTLPSYNLLLQNLSTRNVIALGISVLVNNRERISAIPQGKEGEPLITALSAYELEVPGATNAGTMSGGYEPKSPPNQKIVIKAAVFDDGSYEGDAEIAATFRAFMVGRKIQLGKVVILIQEALTDTDTNVSQGVEKFKTQVSSLSSVADAAALDELRKEFPGLNEKTKAELKTAIEVVLNRVKVDLLKSLREFEKHELQSSDTNALRAWLSFKKEGYEKWLSRL